MSPEAVAAALPGSDEIDIVIEIALATFNGAPYLVEQLDSLARQRDCGKVRIIVGDDGSGDATPQLLERLQDQYHLHCLPPGPGRGAAANFSRILAATTAPYVALCDQDDVWDSDKLAVSLHAMQKLEAAHGTTTPLLVFSDLRVVDRERRPIAPSFWRYQATQPERCSVADLLLQNVVTGCTVLVNRALLQRALPIPPEAQMHDGWLGLVAAACGHLAHIPQPTLDYRQHGGNEVGAQAWAFGRLVRRARQLWHPGTAGRQLQTIATQAQALAARHAGCLSARERAYVDFLGQLPALPPHQRMIRALRFGIRRQGVLRTLGWYGVLLRARMKSSAPPNVSS